MCFWHVLLQTDNVGLTSNRAAEVSQFVSLFGFGIRNYQFIWLIAMRYSGVQTMAALSEGRGSKVLWFG